MRTQKLAVNHGKGHARVKTPTGYPAMPPWLQFSRGGQIAFNTLPARDQHRVVEAVKVVRIGRQHPRLKPTALPGTYLASAGNYGLFLQRSTGTVLVEDVFPKRRLRLLKETVPDDFPAEVS